MKKRKNKKKIVTSEEEGEKHYCSVCGREIDKDEYESFDEMCWECWDDQLTEESDDMFGELI